MKVELTDVGKTWIQEHHPEGIVWEYVPDKPFKLRSVAAEFVELTYLGTDVDGKPTIKKVTS